MYPDTDLPPIALSEERIKHIQAQLPKLPWKRRDRYQKLGLPEFMIDELLLSQRADIFDKLISEIKVEPKLVAVFLTQILKNLKRKGLPIHSIDNSSILAVFKAYVEKKIVRESIPLIIENWLQSNTSPIENIISYYQIISESELREIIKETQNELHSFFIHDEIKKFSYLMGLVMEKVRGRVNAKMVADLTAKVLKVS